jgi:hypothetical protein
MHAAPFAFPVQSPSDRHSTQPPVVVSHMNPGAQSVLARHPTHCDVCVLQTRPQPFAQSALVVHPVHLGWQKFEVVLQAAPAGLPVQSPSDTQPTQRPVDVLQTVTFPPAQSEFDVQATSHANPRQISPAGQSALVAQPHAIGASGGPPDAVDLHNLPPVDVAQSAAAAHVHVYADVSQVGPRGLAAQSALVEHPERHRPVAVSHTGPAGLPAQSALLAQALMHWLPWPHTRPLAQALPKQPQTG